MPVRVVRGGDWLSLGLASNGRRSPAQPDAWREWWHDPEARTYYFIGKDNIPFHAVIWPAQLIGVGKTFDELIGSQPAQPLILPYDVPANEFMNLEGQKISGSRNWAVWGRDFLTRYDPDPLRYYLTVTCPKRATPIGTGKISTSATTMSWWRPGATWPTACCPSPTRTLKGRCPTRAAHRAG